MAQIKPKELRKQDPNKIRQTLFDLRSELSKIAGDAQRGIVKKDVGKIRRIRKDVAAVLTVMHERGISE